MSAMRLVLVGAAAVLAGCQSYPVVSEGNYMTFEYPFEERTVAAIRERARDLCADRNMGVEQTSNRCTLTRCVTSFQCLEPPAAAPKPEPKR